MAVQVQLMSGILPEKRVPVGACFSAAPGLPGRPVA